MLITDKRLRSFNDTKCKRIIDLSKLKGFTKNHQNGDVTDFIIHVDGEYDYRYLCNDRDHVIQTLRALHYNLKQEKLPIYSVNGALEYYMTSKKDRLEGCAKGFPHEDMRCLEQEEVLIDPKEHPPKSKKAPLPDPK